MDQVLSTIPVRYIFNFNFQINLEFVAATMEKSVYMKEEKLY